ncbi:MAG: hypothetical protein ABIJ00_00085 [Candidatus Eisenbacteria bacterium]
MIASRGTDWLNPLWEVIREYNQARPCVRGATGPVFWIQIRSVAMHYQAERGVASHGLYKEQQYAPVPDRPPPARLLRRLLRRSKGGPNRFTGMSE